LTWEQVSSLKNAQFAFFLRKFDIHSGGTPRPEEKAAKPVPSETGKDAPQHGNGAAAQVQGSVARTSDNVEKQVYPKEDNSLAKQIEATGDDEK
jgi:hypothetical protein